MTKIEAISVRARRALCSAPEGIELAKLCAMLKSSSRATEKALWLLAEQGHAASVLAGRGKCLIWCAPVYAHAIRATQAEIRAARERANAKAANERKKELRAIRKLIAPIPDSRDCWPVVQRVIPASKAMPIRLPAVNSVWSLAA